MIADLIPKLKKQKKEGRITKGKGQRLDKKNGDLEELTIRHKEFLL